MSYLKKFKNHLGHKIECVAYGAEGQNISIECIDCNEVLIDTDTLDEIDIEFDVFICPKRKTCENDKCSELRYKDSKFLCNVTQLPII